MIELQPTTYQLILYYTTHSTRKQSLSLSTNRTDGSHIEFRVWFSRFESRVRTDF
jgi:hypothetical protein